MKSYKFIIVFCISLILIYSCKTTTRLSNIDMGSEYNPELSEIKPILNVYHHSENESTFYFSINSDEIKYIKKADEPHFKADLTISYKLLPSFESTKIIDSLSVRIKDSLLFETGNYLSDSVVIFAPNGSNYIMHLSITDHNRNTGFSFLHNVNKESNYTFQNFKIFNPNGEKLTMPFIQGESILKAIHNSGKSFSLQAALFGPIQSAARPPFLDNSFSALKLEADSTFTVDFIDGTGIIHIIEHGHYRFFPDNDTVNGFSVYFFHEGFPYITIHESMLMPIRYLVSNTEFNNLRANPDTRSAIDRFWLGVAGNPERARSLVSRYYNNVQNSNIYFTSYKEGWKTDRGIIYTIYGSPDLVFISDRSEVWHYKNTWGMMELQFEFIRQNSIYTDNHYILKRKPEYRNPWFMGIENWRK